MLNVRKTSSKKRVEDELLGLSVLAADAGKGVAEEELLINLEELLIDLEMDVAELERTKDSKPVESRRFGDFRRSITDRYEPCRDK